MATKAFAPAKINLTLHVTGRRDDGYHLLDSLVVFADLGDQLTFNSGPVLSLEVGGEFADGVPTDKRNLVWKAAEGVGWTGQIELRKSLPHGAGIGGGSSDAAATLCALAQQGHAVPPDLPLSLGADVPVCQKGRAIRMQGIGDQLVAVNLPHLPALLVNPNVHVPTGAVFNALASRDNPAMPENIPEFQNANDCALWLSDQRNDLEVPAMGAAHEIEQVLDTLQTTNRALIARMSGSGSTCFALYPTMKDAHFAAYEIGAAHPDWWCRATQLN
ncbi:MULTISPECIES: 4-(cytidine 5'-diphospho)-2-C-methyl-D-erythritol kinase [unclassified Ruegeria]|uniref:4-(cytidine 5'-diphospho)-2-C-methyl-D-erythritol kinase n=1 Tax=unclassified Ruegeria TaxID=2625375 RepID=UPI001492CE21|nr:MULTISPECIES: 4-(cytidine 5'-diphospho)-2-C-methyl-D-erythritol kinase [unclassified Ruegeria]NOD34935.1 4-(cytidine 5'-diphospho)-2-C-methyl-D-erythritol kinase [Ruegeria sp. HKCCD7296]NOE42088.1 4-(cytidine 5'-diphospho)-2-C-methyl-D-erythritol kinase [Ruegeria sp. HKCCD7319]